MVGEIGKTISFGLVEAIDGLSVQCPHYLYLDGFGVFWWGRYLVVEEGGGGGRRTEEEERGRGGGDEVSS